MYEKEGWNDDFHSTLKYNTRIVFLQICDDHIISMTSPMLYKEK